MKKYSVIFVSLLLLFIPCLNVNAKEKYYLDYPLVNSLQGDSIYVQGWLMSDNRGAYVKIFIDDIEVSDNISRYKRDDVIRAVTGYGSILANPTPGFNAMVDISKYGNGSHKIDVIVFNDSNIQVGKMSSNFIINRDIAKMCLDSPTNISLFDDKVIVEGWLMSPSNAGGFKVYVDDVSVDFRITRIERDDVIKAITGYGDKFTNSKPGFNIEFDSSNLNSGNHSLKIEYINSADKVILTNKSNITVKRGIAKMYLDSPVSDIDSSSMFVKGWVMSPNTSNRLKLYIDDELVTDNFNMTKRDDVIKTITGYGDEKVNPYPGFEKSIDLSGYKDGMHKLSITVSSQDDNVITSVERNFKLIKYDNRAYIDDLEINPNINGDSYQLRGWALTTMSDSSLKIYIDNKEVNTTIKREVRNDVLKSFGSKYGTTGQNKNSGFTANLDLSSYKDGNHQVTLKIVDNKTGEEFEGSSRSFNLKKYDNKAYLDNLVSSINGDSYQLKGWALTTMPDSSLKIYIDEMEVSADIEREVRSDVLKTFGSKYGTNGQNAKPGFKINLDLKNYKDGKHKLTLKVINNKTEEAYEIASGSFNLKKYEYIGYIDELGLEPDIKGTSYELEGWVLTSIPNSSLKIYVDETEINTEILRESRDDALKIHGDKYGMEGQNAEPGFRLNLDLSNLSDGLHNVFLKVVDNNTSEEFTVDKNNFNLRKYDGWLNVDYPSKSNYSNSSILTIAGWELSELDGSIVKVYVDNKEMGVVRSEREDVLNAYPSMYGDVSVNQTPGFTTNVSLSNYSAGVHNVSVKLYTRLGDLIGTYSKSIYVYDNMYFGIDVSKYQNRIDWTSVAKTGLDFAIIRLGVGDNFTSQDDAQFINNVNGCAENGIPYGVYLYSYAVNLNGASDLNQNSESIDSEIQHTLRLLNSLNAKQKSMLKLPVFLDMEDDSTVRLGKGTLTRFADYYCSNIQSNGYKCGIYANRNWLWNYLNTPYLESKYEIWMADPRGDYNITSNYEGIYQLWQYSWTGSILGITSNGLDMDVSFKKYW